MKLVVLAVLFFGASLPRLIADGAAIRVVEHSSRGESKAVGAVSADDDATRVEILGLWKDAKMAFPKDRRNLYGPDSGYVEITVTNGEEEIVVRSWHPLVENNPNMVVTSHGVESLEGRSREQVLKADKAWYREARKVFDRIVTFTKTKAKQADAGQPASRSESEEKPEL